MCYRIQIVESTSNQLACSLEQVICYRIQVLESTSNQLARSLEQVTCYRIQVYDLTSNQAMCSVDRLTYHRTQLINLTSNRAICQMPLPCPLTFRASSIKHWIPIQIPPPFHYPNTPYQIPHQVHPHRPKRQSQTTNRLTNPHSICTSTPSKERVQATNNRLPTNTQSVHPLPPKSVYKPTTTDSQPHPSCTSPPPEGLGEAPPLHPSSSYYM